MKEKRFGQSLNIASSCLTQAINDLLAEEMSAEVPDSKESLARIRQQLECVAVIMESLKRVNAQSISNIFPIR
ncbi:hypothetical protein JVX91_19360 [Pseudomonas sp. PDNC002]|uniref:hypothetical protein n=1 Tax=Pseudomonas sp. PDNC002 TaxID=2811422 RepID=UPI0019628201|nr:hypothetical protein [Pseudomonas sp. PDNC002]QRY77749.1 hypothetical protein JVX91_19360 [Pseudomonas sp. PDNC002]